MTRSSGFTPPGCRSRDIQAHLEDLYGLRVSPDLISRVTDAVLDEVREWQHRALDRMYPIVIFDALRVKIRDADSRMVKNKAVYIALGVTRDGEREVLGLWIADSEGAKFWLSVMNELRNRIRHLPRTDGVRWLIPGHPDRRRGRAKGLPRGNHCGLSRDNGPDLHRAPDPAFDEFLQLEGSQGGGGRPASDLRGPNR